MSVEFFHICDLRTMETRYFSGWDDLPDNVRELTEEEREYCIVIDTGSSHECSVWRPDEWERSYHSDVINDTLENMRAVIDSDADTITKAQSIKAWAEDLSGYGI